MANIFLIGPPCAGKTTICNLLTEHIGFHPVRSGDIARHMATWDEETAEALAQGKMAPEAKMNQRMLQVLIESAHHYIVDGYPRYFQQLLDVIQFVPGDHFFFEITALGQVLYDRAEERRRGDDKLIDTRMQYYYEYTQPMINWLRDRKLSILVNGEWEHEENVKQAFIDRLNIRRGYPPGLRAIIDE